MTNTVRKCFYFRNDVTEPVSKLAGLRVGVRYHREAVDISITHAKHFP
jgi:hypothetical protein